MGIDALMAAQKILDALGDLRVLTAPAIDERLALMRLDFERLVEYFHLEFVRVMAHLDNRIDDIHSKGTDGARH